MPIDSILQIKNLDDLGPSIVASLSFADLLLFTPTLVTTFIYIRYFHNRLPVTKLYKFVTTTKVLHVSIRNLLLPTVAIVSVGFSLLLFNAKFLFFKDNLRARSILSLFYVDSCKAAARYGLLSLYAYQLGEIISSEETNKQDEIRQIETWLQGRDNKLATSIEGSHAVNKNLVIILVESLESWPLEKLVEHQELTPHLNRLLQDNSTVYASKVVPQTYYGRSSDAQFMINTGLLPVNNGAAFVKYYNNYYYSLAKALKDKANYSSYIFVGDSPTFWNQGAMTPSLGFDGLESSLDFNMTDKIGMGLSDESFFDQSVEKLLKLPQPFYLQLITLSSHPPFKIPANKSKIKIPACYPAVLSDYMKSIHYTDAAIGSFLDKMKDNGLYDNTIFVIAGDHEAFAYANRKELLKSPQARAIMSEDWYIPLLIINSPISYHLAEPIGQIDIYPTLLEMMGITDYPWKGLGTSIFAEQRPGFVLNSHATLVGDTSNVTNDLIKNQRSTWTISNYIIKNNYFLIHLDRVEDGTSRISP